MGLPSSVRVPRDQTYSRGQPSFVFEYGTVTLCGADFQRLLLTFTGWRAGPLSLDATQGVAVAFLSCGY